MEEILGVTVLILLYAYVPLGAQAIGRHWATGCLVGVAVTLLSLLVSLAAGARYHLALYRALAPRGLLPRSWIWAPTRYHHHLLPDERAPVLRAFYVGAAAFVCALAGCILVAGSVAYGLKDELAWERIAS